MIFYQHFQTLINRNEKYFCCIFLNISILHNGHLVKIPGRVILYPSPFLESIHCKLYCHNAVVNVIAVIYLRSDFDFFILDRIKLIQLIQDLRFEFVFCFLPYDPMLRGIERI